MTGKQQGRNSNMNRNKKSGKSNKISTKGIIGICIAAVVVIAVIVGISLSAAKESKTYLAKIEIQDYGTVTVQLDAKAAPITVENFVKLAGEGFYDGLTFHRIIEGFMMQGGDPNGNGTGGSGKNIKGEFSANGVNNTLSHTRGAVSMARSQKFDSASSQFFIVQQDSTYLDGQYAVFGYVTDGMDIVDKICTEAEPVDNNGTIPADAQPVITRITIEEQK